MTVREGVNIGGGILDAVDEDAVDEDALVAVAADEDQAEDLSIYPDIILTSFLKSCCILSIVSNSA